jgi:hypothetical protein
MTEDVHNPISGVSNPKAGFVMTDAMAQTMFSYQLRELQPQLLPVVRKACRVPEAMPEETLRQWVETSSQIAIQRGMRSVNDVVAFLVLLRQMGPQFYEFPAIKKALASPDAPADGKVEWLFLQLPLAIWAVVQRRSGKGAA